MKIQGIYVPIITTFNADLSINYEDWGRAIDWQIENGTYGIIVGGSTGEFFSLTMDERIEQLRFAKQRIAGRAVLVAGINDLLTDRTFELAEASSEIGVDALLVAAPPYSLPSQSELVAHVLRIDRLVDLPIILYNYPGRTGVNMEPEFLDRVASSRNVCAIKESSGDVDRIHLLARDYPQLQLSAGAEDQVLEFFAWGATSWVSVVANFFPHEAVRFYETCVLEDDFKTGRRIMSALLPLMYCLERGGKFLQSVKYACEIMNRPGGPVRPPMQAMKKDLQREVFQIVTTAHTTLRAILNEKG
jgi:4-hydroxy-tetrahydrodipicolinate synthase